MGIFTKSAPSVYCSSSSSFYISRSRWMGDLGFEGQSVIMLNLPCVPNSCTNFRYNFVKLSSSTQKTLCILNNNLTVKKKIHISWYILTISSLTQLGTKKLYYKCIAQNEYAKSFPQRLIFNSQQSVLHLLISTKWIRYHISRY